MGDAADMILEGLVDAETGEYIDGDAPGYPRTLNGSLPWEKNCNTRAAVNGVSNYVKHNLGEVDVPSIVNEYLPNNLTYKAKCREIQKDFGTFVKFIRAKKKSTS